MKLGKNTGSVMNHIYSQCPTEPEVGMGASILAWSDRYAATIVKVTKCQVHVQRDTAKVVGGDYYGGFKYEYHRNPEAPVVVFRKTKRGWSAKGYGLLVGVRQEYVDPTF